VLRLIASDGMVKPGRLPVVVARSADGNIRDQGCPPGRRGYTDMRCGFPSLALRVQEVLQHDPLSGHLFVFRGRRSDILKIIWHDGLGACLFTRRLEKGRFIWPNMG